MNNNPGRKRNIAEISESDDNDNDQGIDGGDGGLDLMGFNKLILSFERKINKNQEMRVKYVDSPEKFMDSELDLDEEIQKLNIIATAPELYPELVKYGAILSLISLLSHENIDISIDVVDLLFELTDPDIMLECEESLILATNLIENNGLESLVNFLSRLDESISSEQDAMHNVLGIFENLVEVRPEVVNFLVDKTKILDYALERMKSRHFSPIKLYFSEILSILLQSSSKAPENVGEMDGIEVLLMAVSIYKRKSPGTKEEEELVENLFDCICSCLMLSKNQRLFEKSEGLNLMLLMIKAKSFCRKNALKTLDFALQTNPASCKIFVDILGLKSLFSAFMRKPSLKLKLGYSHEDTEHVISCICSLFKCIEPTSSRFNRLLNKFLENNFEKIERLMELYIRFSSLVAESDKNMERKREEFRRENFENDIELMIYLERLDSGLSVLQNVCLIMAYTASSDKKIMGHLVQLFSLRNKGINELVSVLKEYGENIGSTNIEESQKQRKEVIRLIEVLETTNDNVKN